jgi:hypothetical protein
LIRATRVVGVTRISCIGVLLIETPNHCNGNCEITKRDVPIDQNRPSFGTHVRRSKEVEVWSIESFKDRVFLQFRIKKRDIPIGEVVWAIDESVSGGQVAQAIRVSW